jgi:hypothetical protein
LKILLRRTIQRFAGNKNQQTSKGCPSHTTDSNQVRTGMLMYGNRRRFGGERGKELLRQRGELLKTQSGWRKGNTAAT